MQWTKPEFREISLAMEVTAYVNTDADPITEGPGGRSASSESEDASTHLTAV